MTDVEHYGTLGVPSTASEQEIVQAYRLLIRRHHPDRVGPSGEEVAAQLNHAYDVLSDPASRRTYDRNRTPPPSHKSARDSPDWVEPDTERSFVPVVGQESPIPTKREWRTAFPPGSRPRLIILGTGVAGAAICIVILSFVGGLTGAVIGAIGGVLAVFRRPRPIAYLFVGAPAGLGMTSLLYQQPLPALGGYVLLASVASWAAVIAATWSFRRLRRRYREHKQWVILSEVAAATGNSVQWVAAVDGNQALFENPETGFRQTFTIWGPVAAGSWVAMNSAGAIVMNAPGTSFQNYQWVERRHQDV